MSHPATERFDLTGPLPDGMLAIEASAGTGKTFALAALATRFIAEAGVAASELLVVTFTRAATTELRARVRQQLVDVAAHLRADPPQDSDDPVLTHLADVDEAERSLRLDRVERAITEFDAATITTIHGFGTQVLATLGVTAGSDLDATLVADDGDLAAEACADVLAAAAVAGHSIEDLPKYPAVLAATKIRANTPDLDVVPAADQPDAVPSQLLFAELVRRSADLMNARRRHAGTLSFDDVLLELRRALGGAGSGAVVGTLRERFRVALIDEFQDTDPVQWAIFSTLFGAGTDATKLVLVGDPKQAIYAFRGANIHTYNDAVAPRPDLRRASLATNWRADGAMISALNTFFENATFGDERIPYVPVDAAQKNEAKRLGRRGGEPFAPLALRLALAPELDRNANKKRPVTADAARRAIFGDLVERVRELLDHGELPAIGADHRPRPVRPSDVAVLVRAGRDATSVQEALVAQGVPAVLSRGGSVLLSPAAEQWRWLLEAMIRPSDPARARTFALSWFGGLTPADIDELDDEALGQLQEQLRRWADTLSNYGVNDFVRRVWSDSAVSTRVLAFPDGDRALTDLDHLAELLQTTHQNGHASIAGLIAVLDTPPATDADADADRDVAARRIESEREAVQIMTIWVSKGLEFPIVCCPTLWSERGGDVIFQDPDTGNRTYDVTRGGDWPDKPTSKERKRLALDEEIGENLRLAYVALTRAKHHTILWWSTTRDSGGTALARALFARTDGILDTDKMHAAKVNVPDDDDVLAQLAPLLARSGGNITAEMHGRPRVPTRPWNDPTLATPDPALDVARLQRTLDRTRRRWSFTAITSRAEASHADPYDLSLSDAGAGDEADPGGDEVHDDDTIIADEAPVTTAEASPHALAFLPAGADFGTLVHSVLEQVDFTADDLDTELADHLDDELAWRFLDLRPVGVEAATNDDGRQLLLDGLHAAIDTPLGPLFGNLRLRDLTRGDRIDEMSFELLLGDGDGDGGRWATDRDVGRTVVRHLQSDDVLFPWAAALAEGMFGVDLAGHLTGSIDIVARVRTVDSADRFVVVDYKTNRLHERGRTIRPGDYGRPAMAVAMAEHHYPLQALLYSVALHRYLRWRLVDYDPAVNLGGAAYLFVRGMNGASVSTVDGHPGGVFSWAIPPALVIEVSDLLAGRLVAGGVV